MDWLLQLDIGLFRLINETGSNPIFDQIMPFVSGNAFFYPALVILGVLLICKGRSRGIICILMLALSVGLCDGWICRLIKDVVARPRPFLTLSDVHCLIGKGGSFSMPSSHAANWFAAVMVAAVYYRRSLWFMLPAACLVSYSRVYNGVHYPSDVLVGALVGAGFAAAVLWVVDSLWQQIGQRWFPLWWANMPSLIAAKIRPQPSEEEAEPVFAPRSLTKVGRGVSTAPGPFREPPVGAVGTPHPTASSPPIESPHETMDKQWLRLGYIIIAILLFARLAYIASGTIQLSEDEAYQWLWSKHLALSYYSKPPLIAYTQSLGTLIWGDTTFGVRFFSPVIAALLSVIVLRFFAKTINARAGFFLLLITTATPLLSAGAILMTVDPLSVLFWTAAMVSGWYAIQPNAPIRYWLWTGLWMGLGFLSKFGYQLVSWVLFFILWAPARKSLRSPGPYLALLINALCLLPVLIWNYQHGWITVQHVAQNAGADSRWHWENLYKYPFRFITAEFGLLNPIFFVAMIWAAIAMWRRNRHNPLLLYFFAMGAPVFLLNLALSFHSNVLPNWIAPSVIPLFCLMIAYWDTRWRLGTTGIKTWLTVGLIFGFAAGLFCHNTDSWQATRNLRRPLAAIPFFQKFDWLNRLLAERYLPVNMDPLHRIRGWSDVARVAGEARNELLSEGKPAFIIADHYGLAGEISFYLPEAKATVTQTPLVYYRSTPIPKNQFFFWPGYNTRKGENAVFVRELDRKVPDPKPAPQSLQDEFESVTDMGIRNVLYHGQLLRPLQFFACRNLK
jgi:4-amino-4-deoxy-L-arabinose transferase-like glycosyltransferase/membrane-associated phospholipid phosphatase